MSQPHAPATVDLHLHSPAGGDYRGDPATTASEIVAGCARVGLDLVVVADHMTIEAWRRFAPLSGNGSKAPCLLPGAEIKVRFGPDEMHFVAVFNPDRVDADFSTLLRTLTPSITKNGSPSAMEIEADPGFVAGVIKASGALCIAAHVDRTGRGLNSLEVLETVRSLADARLIDAIEFDDPAEAAAFASCATVPRVTSSDAHSVNEIGRRHTELLISELSFPGLRHALARGRDAVTALHAQALVETATPL